MKHRNIGLIGSPNSGTNELFEVLLRHTITPNPVSNTKSSLIDYGAEQEVQEPYNSKKREKIWIKL